jgi:hypothetical protein
MNTYLFIRSFPGEIIFGGCVKSLLMALRAKLNLDGGCVKSVLTALRAELYFVRHIIFTISRSEIVKMMCLTKEYSAAAGGRRLSAQLHIKFFSAKPRIPLVSR